VTGPITTYAWSLASVWRRLAGWARRASALPRAGARARVAESGRSADGRQGRNDRGRNDRGRTWSARPDLIGRPAGFPERGVSAPGGRLGRRPAGRGPPHPADRARDQRFVRPLL